MNLKPITVDIEGAAALTSLSVSTIEAEERAGNFPRKRQLSGRRTGYLVAEIEAWASSRPVSGLAPPENSGHGNRRRKGQEQQA